MKFTFVLPYYFYHYYSHIEMRKKIEINNDDYDQIKKCFKFMYDGGGTATKQLDLFFHFIL